MGSVKPANRKDKADDTLLRVGSTLVYLMGEVGIFHFNKLIYLFEYLYIKNYGHRFTGEQFIKITHGPVIKDYKKKINTLVTAGYVDANLTLLNKRRKLDDKLNSKIYIRSTEHNSSYIIADEIAFNLLQNIIDNYGYLSVEELEKVAYSTEPVINYLNGVRYSPWIKETGGYVLKSPNIKIRECQKDIPEWKKMALEHINKYPVVTDHDQMKQDYEDFKDWEKLRPKYD